MGAAFYLLKTFCPIIAVALAFAGTYFAGYHQADKIRIEQMAVINAQSSQIWKDAHDKAASVQQQLEQSAKIIGDTYDKQQIQNDALAEHNSALLSERLRVEASRRCAGGVPKDTGTTSRSDGASSGTGTFLESFGRFSVDQSRLADSVSDSLRACQAYVVTVEAAINGQPSN